MEKYSMNWWKDLYELKSKDSYDKPFSMFELYKKEEGFAQFSSSDSSSLFIIYHVCGNANYWQMLAKRLALLSNKTHLATIIKRNPIAYCRGRKWKIFNTEYFGEDKYMRIKAVNEDGFMVIISQQGFTDDNRPIYYVTEKVK